VNKVQSENTKRLDTLYKQSHNWLIAVSFNLCKDKETSDELVQELYLYLAEKCNPALWYLNSFNLMYCHSFIRSRFFNKTKVDKRRATLSDDYDEVDIEYNMDYDEKLENTYDNVVEELKRLEQTKLWAPSKLAQMYFFSDKTLEGLSKDIGISKSTTFLHVKKIKKHIKETLQNPFTPED
jgi:DNA-directed RNA polymerase specialized sigma24 family protein